MLTSANRAAVLGLARVLAAHGKVLDAGILLQGLVRLAPDDADVWSAVAGWSIQQRRWEEAAAACARAREHGLDLAGTEALGLVASGRIAEARSALRRAAHDDPHARWAQVMLKRRAVSG